MATYNPSLKRHYLRSHPETAEARTAATHSCKYCNFRAADNQSLKIHYLRNHPETPEAKMAATHPCKYCNFRVAYNLSLKRHYLRSHPETPEAKMAATHACKHCSYRSVAQLKLRAHLVARHPETAGAKSAKSFACPHCKFNCVHHLAHKRHLVARHPDSKEALDILAKEGRLCPECGYKTLRDKCMNRHIDVVHRGVCSYCRKFSPGEGGRLAMEEHLRQQHSHLCTVCGHVSRTKFSLGVHMSSVHKMAKDSVVGLASSKDSPRTGVAQNPNYLRCHACEFSAALASDLSAHVLDKHDSETSDEDAPANNRVATGTDANPGDGPSNSAIVESVTCDDSNSTAPVVGADHEADNVAKETLGEDITETDNRALNTEEASEGGKDLRSESEAKEATSKDVELPNERNIETKAALEIGTNRDTLEIQHLKSTYSCFHCDYKGAKKRYVKRHFDTHHKNNTDRGRHLCPKCDFKASTRMALDDHQETAHAQYSNEEQLLEHSCFHCDYKGAKKHNVKRHFDTHHKNNTDQGTHPCPKCNFKAPTRIALDDHQVTAHAKYSNEEQVGEHRCFHCNYCGAKKFYIKRHFDAHHKNNTDRGTHPCARCNFKAPTRIALDDHQATAHAEQKQVHMCHHCDYMTWKSRHFATHFGRLHSVKEAAATGLHPCKRCPFKASDRTALDEHIAALHPDEVRKHRRRNYRMRPCFHCDFRTPYNESLMRHLRLKHAKQGGESPCLKCSYAAPSSADLAQHMESSHPPEGEKFSCFHCDFEASSAFALKRHFTSEHSNRGGGGPHPCSDCAFKARSAYALRDHRSSHRPTSSKAPPGGGAKLNCFHCDFSTYSRSSLRYHFSREHTNRGGQGEQHPCQKCAFKAPSRSALSDHGRSHEKFPCPKCSHGASSADRLKSHLAEMHGDSCPRCRIRVDGGDAGMEDHLRLAHTHLCSLCGYITIFERYLAKHMARVHKTNSV